MVLQVMKWDIHPDKVNEYMNWAQTAIKRTVSAPNVVEFRAYRPIGGTQVVTTVEFESMKAWVEFYENEDMKKIMEEIHTLALNVNVEVWGPSPVVPTPIKP